MKKPRPNAARGPAERRFRWARPAGVAVFAALATGGTASCDAITGGDQQPPDQASVAVDGTTSVPLRLVTSTDFLLIRDLETGEEYTELVNADTALLATLPFQRDYPVGSAERFLVRLVNPDSAVATVRLRVSLDGELQYDQLADISQGGSLEYSYRFLN